MHEFIFKPNEPISQKLSKARKTRLKDELIGQFLGMCIPWDVIEVRSDEVLIPASKKIGLKEINLLVKHYRTIECEPSPFRNLLMTITRKYL